jgi:hypothetical protein
MKSVWSRRSLHNHDDAPIVTRFAIYSGFRQSGATGHSPLTGPMPPAVIGGLITSTLLTLIVVPVALTYADHGGLWLSTLARRRAARRRLPPPMVADR